MGKILEFPFAATPSIDSIAEQSPAPGPSWAGPRLLNLSSCCVPREPADVAHGVIVWDRFNDDSPAREGYSVELRYFIRPILKPEWGPEGQWFAMGLHRPDGSLLTEIPLRKYAFDRWPEMYCPNCHTSRSDLMNTGGPGPCANEDTGEAHCYDCAEYLWPDMRAAREQGNWSWVKCTRIVLDGREREKKRALKSRIVAKWTSLSFFERHPRVLSLPRAYKVFNRTVQQTALGYFIADPGLMPIVESVEVIAQRHGQE